MTAHPFCSTLGPHDCRITTRYDEQFFNCGLFRHSARGGPRHLRAGPADRALSACRWARPSRWAFTSRNRGCGRTWSAAAGRSGRTSIPRPSGVSRPPWATCRWTSSISPSTTCRPSLIRIEADEATYNLHILIRFELERAMLDGDLQAADLPGAWNEKYQQYLGITPPERPRRRAARHPLERGLIGYFPTYSLGNLYAAQFFAQADTDLGDGLGRGNLAEQFARGEVCAIVRLAVGKNPSPRPARYRGRAGSKHHGQAAGTRPTGWRTCGPSSHRCTGWHRRSLCAERGSAGLINGPESPPTPPRSSLGGMVGPDDGPPRGSPLPPLPSSSPPPSSSAHSTRLRDRPIFRSSASTRRILTSICRRL